MAQLGERRGIKHGMKSAALAWRGMLEGTINPAKGESMTDQETPERAHVTADDIEAANDLIDFIEACPSMFHTAATIMAELDEAGFTYLPENAAWDIEPGGRYYTQRNTSSVVAFKVGEDLAATWGERRRSEGSDSENDHVRKPRRSLGTRFVDELPPRQARSRA